MPETVVFGDLPWEIIILIAIIIIFIIVTLMMEPTLPEGGLFAFLFEIPKFFA